MISNLIDGLPDEDTPEETPLPGNSCSTQTEPVQVFKEEDFTKGLSKVAYECIKYIDSNERKEKNKLKLIDGNPKLSLVQGVGEVFENFLDNLYNLDFKTFEFVERFINVSFGWLKDYGIISRDVNIAFDESNGEERRGYSAYISLNTTKTVNEIWESEIDIKFGIGAVTGQSSYRIARLVVKMIVFVTIDNNVVSLVRKHNNGDNLRKWLHKYDVTDYEFDIFANLIDGCLEL